MSSPARIRRWTESEASFIYQSKSKIKNFIGYPAELLENKYLIRPSQVFCRNPGAIKTFGGSIEIFLSIVKNSLSVFIRIKSWDPTFSFLSQKSRGEHLRTSARERSPNFGPAKRKAGSESTVLLEAPKHEHLARALTWNPSHTTWRSMKLWAQSLPRHRVERLSKGPSLFWKDPESLGLRHYSNPVRT